VTRASALIFLVFALTAPAAGAQLPEPDDDPPAAATMPLAEFAPARRAALATANSRLRRGECRTRSFHYPSWAIPPNVRPWNLAHWQAVARDARGRVCWARMNSSDFDVPLARAARTFGASFSHLHSCSHSEGNNHRGGFIMNREGSGAGGWMQFMRSTFYGYVDEAFEGARARGDRVPWRYSNWYSKVGQAYTAAYMFGRGLSSHWTGAGC